MKIFQTNRRPGGRHRAGSDDQGSIAMAMLVITLCMSMSALLIPSFLRLNNSTRIDIARVHALNAAESGLQVGLGAVRAAQTTAGLGLNALLPCGSLLSGLVSGGIAQYKVSMMYFTADPRGQSATWRTANQIPCASLPSTTPSFVALTSTGVDASAFGGTSNRTLDATYVIRTNNVNIPGGLIQNYFDGVGSYLNLCLDGGSSSPPAGTAVTMQPCQYNVPDQQKFSYRNNLSLVLNSSVTTLSAGMCLQAGASGATVGFAPCLSSGDPNLYLQQWSFNDSAEFQNSNANGTLGSLCMDIQTLDFSGSAVVMGTCSGLPQRQESWIPSPAAGAGMAGPNTNQLIDFKQFGRCLDLQSWSLSNPLIAWPCKQTPTGAPGWNQRWVYNSTTDTLSTDYSTSNSGPGNPATPYCAKAPDASASDSGLRVYVAACPDPGTPTPANLQWVNHTSSTDTYRDKYTFTDFTGKRCLEPSDTDYYTKSANSSNTANNTSYVVVAPCDGSLLQKWNGDPNVLLGSPLRDANER